MVFERLNFPDKLKLFSFELSCKITVQIYDSDRKLPLPFKPAGGHQGQMERLSGFGHASERLQLLGERCGGFGFADFAVKLNMARPTVRGLPNQGRCGCVCRVARKGYTMTPNRRISLNIAATYGRSLYAPVIGMFFRRRPLMAPGEADCVMMGGAVRMAFCGVFSGFIEHVNEAGIHQ